VRLIRDMRQTGWRGAAFVAAAVAVGALWIGIAPEPQPQRLGFHPGLSGLPIGTADRMPWQDAVMTAEVTPLFNRLAVQLSLAEPLDAGTYLDAHVDCRVNGHWRRGTEFLMRYDADEAFANCFNLPEDAQAAVQITARIRDSATDAVVGAYQKTVTTTTLSSATPQVGGRTWYLDTVNGNNSTGDGLTPETAYQWLNVFVSIEPLQPGDTIRIVNGNFSGGTSAQTRLRGISGTADNWIKIEPCPAELLPEGADPTITRGVALDGTWTDEGDGVFSMDLASLSATDTIGNVWDATIERHLYPFKSEAAFTAATIGDGTGYWVDLVASTTHVLYVRLASGANPGTGRLTGAWSGGLSLQSGRYIVVDGLTFEHFGSLNAGGAGLQFNDFTAAVPCEFMVIRNCHFAKNNTDISFLDGSGTGVNHMLVEDCEFLFDGPWPHFYSDFAPGTPYSQAASWSHIKGSAWEHFAIFAQGHKGIVVRNNYCRGKQFVATALSTNATHMKHYHQHGNTIEECWDDALGDIEKDAAINAALHGETVRNATTLIGLSPYNNGPLWLFACSIDGFVHYPLKVGNQVDSVGGAAVSHGPKVIANISAKAVDWGSDDYRNGMQTILGGHSGLEVDNYVLHGRQAGGASDALHWLLTNNGGEAGTNYTVVTPNVWRRCLFHAQNNATPVVPNIRWRAAAAYPGPGTLTNYATFDLANAGIGPTDTQFEECAGTWSDNGDPNPFLGDVADGLNPAITTKSRYVRGITDLAGDADGNDVLLPDLRIGAFPLRAAE
jgi:hypothetical protein